MVKITQCTTKNCGCIASSTVQMSANHKSKELTITVDKERENRQCCPHCTPGKQKIKGFGDFLSIMQETVRSLLGPSPSPGVPHSGHCWSRVQLRKARVNPATTIQKAPALWFGLLQCAAADRLQVKLPCGKERFTMRDIKFYQVVVGRLS